MEFLKQLKSAQEVTNSLQPTLLDWCRNSNATLKERWDAWSSFAIKSKSSYMHMGKDATTTISEIFELWITSGYFDRGETITYTKFLNCVCETWLDDNKFSENVNSIIKHNIKEFRDKKINWIVSDVGTNTESLILPKTDEEFEIFIKEQIMISNFGETKYDW